MPRRNMVTNQKQLVHELTDMADGVHGQVDIWLGQRAAVSTIPSRVDETVKLIREAQDQAGDLQIRYLKSRGGVRMVVVALDGLTNEALVDGYLLRPIARDLPAYTDPMDVEDWLVQYGIRGMELKKAASIHDLLDRLTRGHVFVLIDGRPGGWSMDAAGFEHRTPQEPRSEPAVRGPREGFVETLTKNTAMIRRRMSTPHLRMHELTAGAVSRTRLVVAYIAGRADPGIVAEVLRRLHTIDLDVVSTSGEIDAYLQDRIWSPFSQTRATERPDVCVAALKEGRVVVMTDGTPFVLIVPTLFWDYLQSVEDYTQHWLFATATRALRLGGLVLMAIVLPVYVATLTYHPELIPTDFLIFSAGARVSLPYPTLIEAFLLMFAFDLIREASARMPASIGGALTIVGALVVGDAAVKGNLASPPMVVLIAITAVSAFVLPAYAVTVPLRMVSYGTLILGGSLGLFGVAMGVMWTIAHLASLTSLGVPFLSPIAPWVAGAQEDTLVRAPWTLQEGPPPFIPIQNQPSGAQENGQP